MATYLSDKEKADLVAAGYTGTEFNSDELLEALPNKATRLEEGEIASTSLILESSAVGWYAGYRWYEHDDWGTDIACEGDTTASALCALWLAVNAKK